MPDEAPVEAPTWPPCRTCGRPIYLIREGRDQCAACAPDEAPWPRLR